MVLWLPGVMTVWVTQPFNQKLQFPVLVAMIFYFFNKVNIIVGCRGLTSLSLKVVIYDLPLLIMVVNKIVCFAWTSNSLFATGGHAIRYSMIASGCSFQLSEQFVVFHGWSRNRAEY